MLEGIKRAVAIFAHTDDEMLAAGTLHRLSRSGCAVAVLTFAPAGIESDRTGTEASVPTVLPEWERSMDLLGIKCRRFAGVTPSYRLKTERQPIAQAVFDLCQSHRPDLALILSPHDEHGEHAAVGAESEAALRGRVQHLWRCVVPWSYGWARPNLFVRLSAENASAKADVIRAYQSQTFRYRYLDMLMGYAKADGLSVNVERAERFEVVRAVV